LAARQIVEEALEGEAADAIGRDYYEHGAEPGQGSNEAQRLKSIPPLCAGDGLHRAGLSMIILRARPEVRLGGGIGAR
jgi:hypothetical protein